MEVERQKKLYQLHQQLLNQLHGAEPEQWPQIQHQIVAIEPRLVEQTRRVLNLSKVYERGCYLCVPGGMLW